MLPPYPAADLDAWIGTPMPRSFANTDKQVQNGDFQSLGAGNIGGTPFDTGFGLPVDAMASSQGGPQAPQDGSPWTVDELSPSNTTFAAGSNCNIGNGCNAQKEVLLAAVDRLIQLASLMQ